MSSNQSGGAVITGAASGIGRAIATALAADGFSVVVADLDEVSGRAAAKEIAAASQGRAIFQRVDVTDRTTVSAAIDACTGEFGSIKVMVNNAGFNKPEPFLEASEAIWHKIMDVNALGVMIGIQEAAKAMIAAGTKGKIINTASIAGRTGYADWAPYRRRAHSRRRASAGRQGDHRQCLRSRCRSDPAVGATRQGSHGDGRQLGARRGHGEFFQLYPARSCRPAQ
jgi:NAD(P)-dependent dehydrogenase (short-subunit alcohol dehydrogenase family)